MSTYDPEVVLNIQATIAAGGSLSEAVNLVGKRVCALRSPSAVTGTTYTFEVSTDGVNFAPFYDQTGTEVTAIHGGTARVTQVDPAQFAAVTHIRVRSGTLASPVTQTTAKVITIAAREV